MEIKRILTSLGWTVILCFLTVTQASGSTMEVAGISKRAQDYINTMQFSNNATDHKAFKNCLRDISSTATVPPEAVVINSEAQLSMIQAGGIYVIRGDLSFENVFQVPSNVTIYVDGAIHRDGTHSRSDAYGPGTENGTDAIFMVDGKSNVKLIGVNNARLTGNWVTGEPTEPGTTAVYVNRSNNVRVEGFDIGYVWEGLVARGGNDHISFVGNYIHDTRKRAIWIITSDHCHIVHNFIENAGADGVDFDAYAYDNIAFENIVIGAGRWLGFVEEGAKRNYFARNIGVMAYFNNPNTNYQMGWTDNGTTQKVNENGGLTEENYFVQNISIRPSQYNANGSGSYIAHKNFDKGWTYFWGNSTYGPIGQGSGDHWYLAEWLDTVPESGQKVLDDLDALYNSAPLKAPLPPTRLKASAAH